MKLSIRHTFVTIGATAVLVSTACSGEAESPTGPGDVPRPNTTINYTAIGASDAAGVGSSVVCPPFTACLNGRGYVQVVERELEARGYVVNLRNLGIPALVLSRRIQDLGAQHGRGIPGNMIEDEARFVQSDTTLFTIFAGANDVDTITAALGGGAGGSDQTAYVNGQIQAFGQDFSTLLSMLRERAPTARIVALNLPNMAGMPRSASHSTAQRRAHQMLSVGINTSVINPLATRGVLVLDLMCDPRSYLASTYSSDGFHPSDQGYAWIAAEVIAAATTTYRAPAGSCSHMTIVQ